MATNSWESLRRQAKQLENEAEAKLSIYAKTAATSNDSTVLSIEAASLLPAWSQAEQVEDELELVLRKLTQTTNQMAEFLDSPHQNTPTNPSMMHVLQRHREILYDYSKEFNRTKANIASAKTHEELISGSSRGPNSMNINSGLSVHDRLLNERNQIDSAHGIADTVLEQAQLTREQLDQQGRTLAKSRTRIGAILNRFPMINNLVSKINTKKKKDQMIIGGVLGVCMFILLWVMFR